MQLCIRTTNELLSFLGEPKGVAALMPNPVLRPLDHAVALSLARSLARFLATRPALAGQILATRIV